MKEEWKMALTVTQTDFRPNFKSYMDKVTEEQETIYIPRPRQKRSRFNFPGSAWLARKICSNWTWNFKAQHSSWTFDGFRIIPEQGERIKTNEDYDKFWEQFKNE